MNGDSPSAGSATADDPADLGLPPSWKHPWNRLIARLSWPVLRRQIELNRRTDAQLADARAQLADARAQLANISETLHARVEQLDEAQKTLERFESTLETVAEILTRHDKLIENVRELDFARQVAADGILRREIGELALELNEFRSTYAMSMASVLPTLAAMEMALDKRPTPEPVSGEPTRPRRLPDLDAFDAALAEAFRGPELVIRDRVREYLPDLESIKDLGPVLDVGCGRGELLRVLSEAGIEAYGVDSNPLCVAACQERDLAALNVDAVAHFESLEPSTLGAVTAIHVVEHLPIGELVNFIDLSMRALKSGGVMIFETPNPENVMVSSLTFYLDPTHRHPLPPDLLKFILASRGIVDIEVRRLARGEYVIADPVEGEPWYSDVKPVIDAFNARFAVPSDYAVIATRP